MELRNSPPPRPAPIEGPGELPARTEAGIPLEDEEGHGPLRRLHHFLHSHPTTIPAFVLLLGVVFFSIAVGHRFLHPFNLSLIIQQVTIIGILGVAQTIIILTAGIDLSVGAIMVLSSVVMGRLAVIAGLPDYLAVVIGL